MSAFRNHPLTRTARYRAAEAARAEAVAKMTPEIAVSRLAGVLQIADEFALAALLSQPNAAELALGLLKHELAARGLDTDARWVGFDKAPAAVGVPVLIPAMIAKGERERAAQLGLEG